MALLGCLALAPALRAQAPTGPPAPPLAAAVQETDGNVQLSWGPAAETESEEAPGHAVYQLQEAPTPAFADPLQRYEGPQTASFVSGLERGTYYYRVRGADEDEAPWGPWSETVQVEILPHPLSLAWGLFALGAVLVTAIVGFLVLADRRVTRGETAT